MSDAFAAADTLRRLRIARGEKPLGYKIGFTNRSIWERYGVHQPIWGPVWDSTTRAARRRVDHRVAGRPVAAASGAGGRLRLRAARRAPA